MGGARIGHAGAVRAVGTALGRNPVPLIVPCHRVLKSTGGLGGYIFGTRIKQRLLELERTVPILEGCTSTHIVCRVGCAHAQRMKPDNRVVFASVDDARSVGYRPVEFVGRRRAHERRSCAPLRWAGLGHHRRRARWPRLCRPPALLAAAECAELAALYAEDAALPQPRRHGAHRFGDGEYKYFAAPLPPLVGELRRRLSAARADRELAGWRALGDRSASRPSSRLARHCASTVRPGRRRCCCATRRADTTACTRISTATSPSRCR